MNKRMKVEQWVNNNSERLLEFVRVMYPEGCRLSSIRGFMRALNQTGNVEGFLRHLEKRGLVKWDKAANLVTLTSKARNRENAVQG